TLLDEEQARTRSKHGRRGARRMDGGREGWDGHEHVDAVHPALLVHRLSAHPRGRTSADRRGREGGAEGDGRGQAVEDKQTSGQYSNLSAKKGRIVQKRQAYLNSIIQTYPAASIPPLPPRPSESVSINHNIFLSILPAFSALENVLRRALQREQGPKHQMLHCLYLFCCSLEPRPAPAPTHSKHTTPPPLPAYTAG
ncbi:hypothetical protein BDN70DRAFT_902402, partial [Pholiota conissans]